MTNQEAIKELQKGMPTFDSTDEECERYVEAYNMAIKALEQEPILEKIRAEIEQTYINITYQENKDRQASWGLRKALDIIDKYKAESEDN